MTSHGQLLAFTPLRLEGRALAGSGVTVVRTGAGPKRSADAVARLATDKAVRQASAIAVAGVAGGLVDDLRPGTLIVADRLLDQTGQPVSDPFTAAPLVASALRAAGLAVRVGPLVSTDRLVRGADARARLARLGALAVDMESTVLAPGPGGDGWDRPTVVVRAIADTPSRELLSPATVSGGVAALRAIRAAGPVLARWAAAVRPRQVLLAGPRSFCAGVERAIQTVEKTIDLYGSPVYVRRQIVHNRHVVGDLEARGAVFVQELDEVPDGATVVYSAHGVAPSVRADADKRGLQVVDATCPLVAKVHNEVRRFAERGYEVILVGHEGHDETEGTRGEARGVQIVSRAEDVAGLHVEDPQRVAYITQTTLSPADVSEVVGALQERFPDLVGPHAADICYATQNRQDAVLGMAADCDVMLVVGSPNSSNTQRLAEVSQRAGAPAHLLDDETELDLDWVASASTIGITAGASAPEAIVERVVAALRGLGPLTVETRAVRTESVRFPLPTEVR